MIAREFLAIALGNLWRMKLRTTLTAAGVMVGVGALVSMLSFGFGIQKNMLAEFRRIGLFRTIQVLPGEETPAAHADSSALSDTSAAPARRLDAAALDTLAAIPGIDLVYPQQSFEARVTLAESTHTAVVQALPAEFLARRPFGTMVAGRFFAADSSHEAVVAAAWARENHIPPDSLVGRTLRVETAGSVQLLAALGRRFLEERGMPPRLAERGAALAARFLSRGRSNALQVTVTGVADVEWGFGFRMGEILLPRGIARDLDVLSFDDPMELLAMASGSSGSEWPMIVATLEHERDYARVKADIERLGFTTLSFPDQLERMRKDFLIFDAFVGLLGFIALFVASLGIANTMIMSILERTREIGILKSLGAEDEHVRALFLAEAAAIGFLGSLAGILLGLGVSRAASFVARTIMVRQEVPPMELFYLPPWVALAAVGFGTLISVLAGLYPAARAARIDPVHALRHD